jgi:hypothetical protein
MTAARRLLAAFVAVVAVGAASSASAAAADLYRPRPHSDFTLRASSLRVARFEVSARPRGDRIEVSVKLTARSRRRDVRVVLRVGRCVGGPATFPSCPPAAGRRVLLHPHRTVVVAFRALLRRPRARTDAIRVSVTRPGRVVRPYRSPRAGIVDMLLPASAWRRYAGRTFGVRIARPWEGDRLPYDVGEIAARAAQIDHLRLRPSVSWSAAGVAPQAVVATTLGPCAGGAACRSWQRMADLVGRVGFGGRPHLVRAQTRQLLAFDARTLDGTLFSLVLPWPR